MSAVVAEDRRQLPAAAPLTVSRRLRHKGQDNFVPLIEGRKTAFAIQIRVVLWAKITVEIGTGIDGFAERVIRQKAEVVAEALCHLENPALIYAGTDGGVLVCLQKQGVSEALQNG